MTAPGQGADLGYELVARMSEMTEHRISELAMANARANRPYFSCGNSIRALRDQQIGNGDSAIVIGAGPSLHKKDFAAQIREVRYDGAIIATDSSLMYCLRNGITPDLVVTIDPHAKRIVRWFGDPELTEDCLRKDDYFSRQDMDQAFSNELAYNQEVLALINQHGSKVRLALSSVSSGPVVKRAVETGMQIYWWNPMLDDPDRESNGSTRELYAMNGFPCINAGGNVGAACWMMAGEVLGKKHVAVIGMDFSYYDGTPYSSTQYYDVAVELLGEDSLEKMFIRTHNPYLDKWFFSDPAYFWYREIFLEMAKDAGYRTYNCTEGGILFGENMEFLPFAEFLERWQSNCLN